MNSTIFPNHTEENITTTSSKNILSQDDNLLGSYENVTSYLWIIISPILFLTGLFGNSSIIAILTKMKFWQKPIYILLVTLAFSDATVLCVGLSRNWIREVFKVDIRTLSEWGCIFHIFVIYFAMQFSSAILVCVTFERFLKTRFPFRYNIIVSVKRTIVLIICIFVFLTALNMFWFFTQTLIVESGDVICDAITPEYFWFEEFIYTYIDLLVLSVIPFVSMVAMNITIQKVLIESKNLRKISVPDEATRKELGKFSRILTKMLLFTSTYFLVSTVPISVYFITDSYLAPTADDLTMAKMDVAWSVTYLFQFSNYAVNFFFYMLTNKAFQRTFRQIFCCDTDDTS